MIRKALVLLIVSVVISPSFSQNATNPFNDSVKYAFIKFDNKTIDLDTVKIRSKTHECFNFCNTGKIPLIIKDVKSSCGCTVVAFNKKPVAPGKCGKIEFYYNAPHKPVIINKYLIVITNTYEKNYMLRIKGKVVK